MFVVVFPFLFFVIIYCEFVFLLKVLCFIDFVKKTSQRAHFLIKLTFPLHNTIIVTTFHFIDNKSNA